MATRSRLGRDPLQGAAKPAAKQPAKKQRKAPTPAPAAGKPPVVAQSVAPDCTNALPLDTVAAPQGDALPAGSNEPSPPGDAAAAHTLPLADQPTGSDASDTDARPVPADAPDRTISADVSDMPAGEPLATQARIETDALAASAASAATDSGRPELSENAAADDLARETALVPDVAPLPPLQSPTDVPALDDGCGGCGSETPQPAAMPQSVTVAGETPAPAQTTVAPLPLDQGIHPVEVFLRGVLEGLLPEGEAALCITVDPETFALPVEKLFYFSHALQRIVTSMEYLPRPDWRPGDAATGLPVLTVRLRIHNGDRHVLTLTDNGQFFRSRLPDIRLDMEALKPLVAFVVKRHGSVRLAQGRFITFEIIG